MYLIRCDRVKQRECKKKIKGTAVNARLNDEIQKESVKGKKI
jgi:hypothetical protein